MNDKVKLIKESLDSDLKSIDNISKLNDIKAKYLGKKGLITELTSNMKELTVDERKEIGKVSNSRESRYFTKEKEIKYTR